MSEKSCGDELLLQRFLDEELSPDAAEIVLFHVDKCDSCSERLQELKVVKAFCRDELGREDELESEFTQNALFQVKSRLDIQRTGAKPQGSGVVGRISAFFHGLHLKIAGFGTLKWRVVTVPAMLVLVFAGLVAWFAISPSSSISADEILSEAERRTAIWEHQPDKVLVWGYETTFTNHRTLPDGKYTSRHWQYNTGGQALRLNRLYNANGVLVSASARRPDGSYVYFSSSRGDLITITPSRDVLLSYAAQLDEKSRQALENYVRSDDQARQISPERDLEIKRKLTTRSLQRSLQIIQSPDLGKIFRVREVILTGKDNSIRMEIEDDFAADSFKRIRNHHVDYYPDGKITTIDSQLKFYQETSIEAFNAHDLSAEVRQSKNIVYTQPEAVLKSALQYEEEKKKRQLK